MYTLRKDLAPTTVLIAFSRRTMKHLDWCRKVPLLSSKYWLRHWFNQVVFVGGGQMTSRFDLRSKVHTNP